MFKMKDLDLLGKRVLIRLDLNVPIKDGVIISDKRIRLSLPTINYAIKKGAKVILCTHLGRPKEGFYNIDYSLYPIVKYLEKKINLPIKFIKNYLYKDIDFLNCKYNIFMLENVRFNYGESSNNNNLSKRYSELCDIFIMDAFATAHRIHSSTCGVMKYVKSCMGLLFCSEINALSKVMLNPKRPLVSIIGGAKVSTKFNVLNFLAKFSDNLIIGGGISNTFISIDNFVGKSLHESSFTIEAKKIRDKYNIYVPKDCRVGKEFSTSSVSYLRNVSEIKEDEEIMDLGDKTIKFISNIISRARTILWNGPVGVFEFPNFSKGTKSIIDSIVSSCAFSVVGGGDTIAALELFKCIDKVSYVSTGGGSFLKFIEGNELPVVSFLKENFILFK